MNQIAFEFSLKKMKYQMYWSNKDGVYSAMWWNTKIKKSPQWCVSSKSIPCRNQNVAFKRKRMRRGGKREEKGRIERRSNIVVSGWRVTISAAGWVAALGERTSKVIPVKVIILHGNTADPIRKKPTQRVLLQVSEGKKEEEANTRRMHHRGIPVRTGNHK